MTDEVKLRRFRISPRDQALRPILVDCVGRGGSTLMMQLLRCSPQVRVEGPFPYERRYFAYFYHWTQLLGKRDWPRDLWNNVELARGLRWNNSIIGPPTWDLKEISRSSETPLNLTMLRAVWDEFSRRARSGETSAAQTYYAEKSVDTHRLDLGLLPDTRLLAVVRDPRDTFVSIEAFNAKRDRTGFGRGDSSDEEFLAAFVERHRRRMEWLSRLGDSPLVIRYEDVVEDAARVAHQISQAFSIEFNASEVAKLGVSPRPEHVTAESIAGSVGRWRAELDPEIEARIRNGLRDELMALGYEA